MHDAHILVTRPGKLTPLFLSILFSTSTIMEKHNAQLTTMGGRQNEASKVSNLATIFIKLLFVLHAQYKERQTIMHKRSDVVEFVYNNLLNNILPTLHYTLHFIRLICFTISSIIIK